MKNILIAALCTMILSGCQYLNNRISDCRDVVNCNVGRGFGALGQMGPVNAGLGFHGTEYGLKNGEYDSYRSTLDGKNVNGQFGIIGGQGFDGGEYSRARNKAFSALTCVIPYESTLYKGSNLAYWTQVNISVDILYGIEIGLNPGEVIDLVLGFMCIDIYGDDLAIENDSAQQVDSAEASTIAVPPSVPSGSPR